MTNHSDNIECGIICLCYKFCPFQKRSYSGEFHVFEYFEGLRDLISNILKDKFLPRCLLRT